MNSKYVIVLSVLWSSPIFIFYEQHSHGDEGIFLGKFSKKNILARSFYRPQTPAYLISC